MKGRVQREHLAEEIPKSCNFLGIDLHPAAIRCPDRGYRYLGSFETLSSLPEGSVFSESDVIYFSKVAFRASLKAACKFRFRWL